MNPYRVPPLAFGFVALSHVVSALAGEPAAQSPPPPAVRDLYRPLETRTFALSPSGRRMVETRSTAHLGWGDPAAAPTLASRQAVAVMDLVTGQSVNLSLARAGVNSVLVRWLDDDRLIWHTADLAAQRAHAELVTLGVAPQGMLEIRDVRLLGRETLVLGGSIDAAGRVLAKLYDDDGISVHLLDPLRPFDKQRGPDTLAAGPLRGVGDYVFDAKGVVRAVSLERRRGDLRIYYRPDGNAEWRRIYTFPRERYENSRLVGFDDASGSPLAITDRGSDKRVLRLIDPATGELGRILAGDARNDVGAPIYHPRTGRLIGVALNDSAVRFEYIDPRARQMQARIAQLARGRLTSIVAFADDGSRAVAYAGGPADPGEYLLYEAQGGKLRSLGRLAPWLADRKLGASRAIEFKARDGVVLSGQFTPPANQRFALTPLVVMPHGGPFGVRDYLFYDPEVQFLATRGYAVLQVDYRGSGGYGRDFLKAGFKQWGRQMQDDLVDAVRWTLAQGWAAADRVCIVGGSYGGYAAAMGVIKTPELFRCAVTTAGVSDLTLLFKSSEVKADPELRDWLKDVIGDPEKDKEAMQRESPAFLARGLTRPLFIAHGEKDTRAEPDHAWRLRSAVEAGGGTVEWFLAAEEGHGFAKPETLEAYYAKLDAFLARHLGGD